MTTNRKKLSSAQPAKNGFSLISDDKFLALYSAMLKCRMLGSRARALLKGSKLAGGIGAREEAIAAAVGIDLLPEDLVSVAPNGFVHLFIKGLPLRKLFARLLNGSDPSLSLTEQLKLVLEKASDFKESKNNKIAVVFWGGESTSRAAWTETLRLAAANKLPILFVAKGARASAIQNSPRDGGRTKLKARGGSFPAITVEGNDAVAVYRVACEAIAHARKGDGPTLIECQSRQPDDPILSMEKYLIRKGLFSEKFKEQVVTRFRKRLEAASDRQV